MLMGRMCSTSGPGLTLCPNPCRAVPMVQTHPARKGRNRASSTAARCLSVSFRQDIRSRMSARFQKFFRLFIVPRF